MDRDTKSLKDRNSVKEWQLAHVIDKIQNLEGIAAL